MCPRARSAVWALCLVVVASTAHLAQSQQQPQQQQPPQPQERPQQQPVSRNRFISRSAAISASNACEYKELMNNLHDRVSVLASLDEDQRGRLDSIEKKIIQFEESNLGRLDSIGIQQMDVNKRLDVFEHLLRMNNRQVEELKGDLIALEHQPQQKPRYKAASRINEMVRSRVSRQVAPLNLTTGRPAAPDPMQFDDSAKLQALAMLLTSTRSAISSLHRELSANITGLQQVTGVLQRRLNNLARRQQMSAQAQGYLPPQPTNFYAPGGGHVGHQLVTSCAHPQTAPTSGIQRLQLTPGSLPFYVMCDEETQGGGWTVIQHRFSGEVNFQRDWLEYKNGFGNLAGEFFIGLEKLHALTSSAVHELLIMLKDFDNAERYARYSLFAIGGEKEMYALSLLGAYEGDAGDALSYHAGSKFSTYDHDNDGWVEGNCAQAHTGAWWYNACEKCNLNGQYLRGEHDKGQMFQGMYWQDFRGANYSLQEVRMMIRPATGTDQYRRR